MNDLVIVSGGQTGVDRGALDAALAAGAMCGGFCPVGRRAEDGSIPERYPLTPTASADYSERTRRNVENCGGTLILSPGLPSAGTDLTLACCRELERPFLLVDAGCDDPLGAARSAMLFVEAASIHRLNVAGPRASEWPGGYGFAFALVSELIRCLRGFPAARP